MGRWWRRYGLSVLTILIAVSMIVWSAVTTQRQWHHFRDQCQEQGGYTVKVSSGHICVGPDGRYLGKE